MDLAQIAQRLGAAEKEIVSFVETEVGVVAHLFDGTSYIDVPKETPDAEGKTGVMYLTKPAALGVSTFPVFTGALPDAPYPAPVEATAPAPEPVLAEPETTPVSEANTAEPVSEPTSAPATAPAAPPAAAPVPVKPTAEAPAAS